MFATNGAIGFGTADQNIFFMKGGDILRIHRNRSIFADGAKRTQTLNFFCVGNETQNVAEWFTAGCSIET